MKLNLSGTDVAVEPFHLERYLDEQLFRFNNRLGMRTVTAFMRSHLASLASALCIQS
jgi:hypothetical protein